MLGQYIVVRYPLSNQLGMLQVQEPLFARCLCSPTSYIKPPNWSSSVKQFTGIVFNLFSPHTSQESLQSRDLLLATFFKVYQLQILDHDHQGATFNLLS